MPALPQGIQKERYGQAALTPDEMIRRVYADKMFANEQTKLTWNPNKPPQVPDDRMVGEVNLNLPSVFIQKTVYYQNSRFYLSNGEPTSLGYISTNFPLLYSACLTAKELVDKDAARRDPLLCKHCFTYRALDPDDYHEHIVRDHPDEVLSSIRADDSVPISAAPSVGSLQTAPFTPPSAEAPPSFVCPDCGKRCKTRMALGSHRRVHKVSEAH